MKSNIEYYLVEGECEDKFIKSSNLLGKIEYIDLSEKNTGQINKWSTKLTGNKKNLYLNIIFDTDVLLDNSPMLLKFIENIKFLKKKGFNIRLLQQHKNFEEELCYSLKVKKNLLFEKFNARNNKEFKHNFISDNRRFIKLQELNQSFLIWSNSCIPSLDEFKHLMHNYSSLSKKPDIK